MYATCMRLTTAMVVALGCAGEAHAGPWGKAVREGIEVIGKRTSKIVGQGAEQGIERAAARKTVREGLEAAGARAARLGGKAAREGSGKTGGLMVRISDDVAAPIVGKFGDDGTRALGSLSSKGSERLAVMADDLAVSGRGRDWMKLIAERGDEVTDWLWQRRGGVAVGTIATAVLLQPEEFLHASEHVATTTINAAGEHLVGPVVRTAAAGIPWGIIWTIVIVAGVCWLTATRQLARLRRQMVIGAVETLASLNRTEGETRRRTIEPRAVREVERRGL